ncbi:hypothetical protein VM98_36690, partial [Streptomyces rubellomurinus subsp. indigoferus]
SRLALGSAPGTPRPLCEHGLHLRGGVRRTAELPAGDALSAEVLAAGQPLDGALVAAIRRTALSVRPDHRAVVDLAAGLTAPLVNPGEAWADQASPTSPSSTASGAREGRG